MYKFLISKTHKYRYEWKDIGCVMRGIFSHNFNIFIIHFKNKILILKLKTNATSETPFWLSAYQKERTCCHVSETPRGKLCLFFLFSLIFQLRKSRLEFVMQFNYFNDIRFPNHWAIIKYFN